MPGVPGKGGKPGRSGRKPKFDEEELLSLLDSGWPMASRQEAIKMLATRASRGDIEAIKLLMAYSYGKPREKHEVSGPEGRDLLPVLNLTLNGAEPPPTAEADGSVPEPGD